MQKKRFMAAALIFAIVSSFPVLAQYESLAGITAESPEYNDYRLCIDACGQCEQNCKTNTYRRAAETQSKEEFCNYLPEEEKTICRERIYMANAIAGKDSEECRKITDEFQKKGCLLNVQTEKAIADESEAECEALEGGFAESCRQAFYMRMASLKNDKSFCDKLPDENAKGICRSSIAFTAQTQAPEAEGEATAEETKGISKSLIIYGIIILGVITAAVAAVVIIKKVSRKEPAQAPLVVQQQKFPPLVMQQPQQNVQQTAEHGEKR